MIVYINGKVWMLCERCHHRHRGPLCPRCSPAD
jgi:hypothetical protein